VHYLVRGPGGLRVSQAALCQYRPSTLARLGAGLCTEARLRVDRGRRACSWAVDYRVSSSRKPIAQNCARGWWLDGRPSPYFTIGAVKPFCAVENGDARARYTDQANMNTVVGAGGCRYISVEGPCFANYPSLIFLGAGMPSAMASAPKRWANLLSAVLR